MKVRRLPVFLVVSVFPTDASSSDKEKCKLCMSAYLTSKIIDSNELGDVAHSDINSILAIR